MSGFWYMGLRALRMACVGFACVVLTPGRPADFRTAPAGALDRMADAEGKPR